MVLVLFVHIFVYINPSNSHSNLKTEVLKINVFQFLRDVSAHQLLQSRPIEMRAKILANQWMDFKILSISDRFLDLVVFLLLAFPGIPQFMAQF